MSSDAECVAQVLGGDSEAFRILVERYQSRLVGVLMRLLCDPVAAEEVAHDAFVKAFTKLDGFRGEAAFGTWLIQIGVNLARDRQRHQTRVHNLGIVSIETLRQESSGRDPSDSWEPADRRSSANPDHILDSKRKWQFFEAALASLPPDFRDVITLRYLEDMEYDEIAALTGNSAGTLKVRNHRARKLLRDRMKKMGVPLGAAVPTGGHFLKSEQEGK